MLYELFAILLSVFFYIMLVNRKTIIINENKCVFESKESCFVLL